MSIVVNVLSAWLQSAAITGILLPQNPWPAGPAIRLATDSLTYAVNSDVQLTARFMAPPDSEWVLDVSLAPHHELIINVVDEHDRQPDRATRAAVDFAPVRYPKNFVVVSVRARYYMTASYRVLLQPTFTFCISEGLAGFDLSRPGKYRAWVIWYFPISRTRYESWLLSIQCADTLIQIGTLPPPERVWGGYSIVSDTVEFIVEKRDQ